MNKILFKILMLKGDAGEPTDEQTQSAVGEYMQQHPEAAIDETIINSAVDDWLDDHPEATTTVQDDSLTTTKYKDGSVTESKLSDSLKLKTLKDYVTPQMFGAVGDGITDDTTAFNNMINAGDLCFIPEGEYLLSTDLQIPYGKKIIGANYLNTVLLFNNGSLSIEGNYVSVSNIAIRNTSGSKTIGGIVLNASSIHKSIIKNVLIYDFKYGIDNKSQLWDCVFENIRINLCDAGLNFPVNASNFAITFINVYIANCTQLGLLNGLYAIFESCNFSIMSSTTLTIGSNSTLRFINCNFESDIHIADSSRLILISSRAVSFVNCIFAFDCGANNSVFETGGNLSELSFEGCYYKPKATNQMPTSRFFNKASLSASRYGAIEFVSGNKDLPKDEDVYGIQIPYFKNTEEGLPICYYSQNHIDTAKLKAGAVLYCTSTAKMMYFNGSALVEL